MARKKWGLRNRIDLYANDDELKMLELLARDNGVPMSAYIRVLIRREWNASPHLHGVERVGKGGEE